MRNFFLDIRVKLQRWMSGRYGYDELSHALFILAIIMLFLAYIPHLQFMSTLALLLWAWSLFRSMSRATEKRQDERAGYLRFTGRIKSGFTLKKKIWKERKTHRFFRCNQCKTVLRVPKGKGKIKITCSKCHSEIVKKT